MQKPIININDLQFTREIRHGEKFEANMAPVGVHIGAKKLSLNVTVVPPGKRAFPFHNHLVNEEFFYILEGTGLLRFGEETYPIRAGDFVSCPPGGKEVAHQFINEGEVPLKYIALSTTLETDVFQYPDSGKFGLAANRQPGQSVSESQFGGFYLEDAKQDYWHGE